MKNVLLIFTILFLTTNAFAKVPAPPVPHTRCQKAIKLLLSPIRTLKRAAWTLPLLALTGSIATDQAISHIHAKQGQALLTEAPHDHLSPTELRYLTSAFLARQYQKEWDENLKWRGPEWVVGNFFGYKYDGDSPSKKINTLLERDPNLRWDGIGSPAENYLHRTTRRDELVADAFESGLAQMAENARYLKLKTPLATEDGKSPANWNEALDAVYDEKSKIAEQSLTLLTTDAEVEVAARRAIRVMAKRLANPEDHQYYAFPLRASEDMQDAADQIAKNAGVKESWLAANRNIARMPIAERDKFAVELLKIKLARSHENASRFGLQGLATRDGTPLHYSARMSHYLESLNYYAFWEDYLPLPSMMSDPAPRRLPAIEKFAQDESYGAELLILEAMRKDPEHFKSLTNPDFPPASLRGPGSFINDLHRRSLNKNEPSHAGLTALLAEAVEVLWKHEPSPGPALTSSYLRARGYDVSRRSPLSGLKAAEGLGRITRIPDTLDRWQSRLHEPVGEAIGFETLKNRYEKKGIQIIFNSDARKMIEWRKDDDRARGTRGILDAGFFGGKPTLFFPDDVTVAEFFADLVLIDKFVPNDPHWLNRGTVKKAAATRAARLGYLRLLEMGTSPPTEADYLKVYDHLED